MEQNTQIEPLISKLARIRSISDAVSKDKRGFNYNYADITEILAKVTAGMKRYHVTLIPSIVPGTVEISQVTSVNTKATRDGKTYENKTTEMLVRGDMIFKWINDDDPEDCISVPWLVVGSQADPSQAFGSGLTYCTRYFLCNYFQIAQPDTDVDAYRTKQKNAEVEEDKAIAAGIIKSFDTLVKGYLSDNPERAPDIKKFVGRFVKNSDYNKIVDPLVASKMMNEFKATFTKTEE